jgi:hypothetical protein
MNPRSLDESPQLLARLAGGCYLVTIIAGSSALLLSGGRLVANLVAAASYVAVTLLFYYIFRPVDRGLSFLAAVLSLSGCALSALRTVHVISLPVNPLVLFGFYCLLIGYLVFKSAFLPRVLGGLMAFGGLGWLTFLSPQLASYLSPYNFAPGILGESVLTMWLLFRGLDVVGWKQRTGASPPSPA